VLASRPARAHPWTLRLAVTLAVLSMPAEPVLGDTGLRVPVLGALHALNGLVICALTGWLMAETGRRRAAKRLTAASGTGAHHRGFRHRSAGRQAMTSVLRRARSCVPSVRPRPRGGHR
jgi:hypothetical protein